MRLFARTENIKKIKNESEIIHDGTKEKIDKMRREIGLIINEYTPDNSDKREPLEHSVRMIKLKCN